MSFDDLLIHPVVIWRSTPGAVDEYNDPTVTWGIVATIDARIVPKSGREIPQANEAGPRSGQFVIYTNPTDVTEADHLVSEEGDVYEVGFVAERSGAELHHLELDATKVYP